MYLFAQLASYLFVAFLIGTATGYMLWRAWGERETIARYNAAEMRLAAHVAQWEKAAQQQNAAHAARTAQGNETSEARARMERQWEETAKRELHEFEAKQAALMREAEVAAIRKAEAAAEKKLADLTRKLGQGEVKSAIPAGGNVVNLADAAMTAQDPSIGPQFGDGEDGAGTSPMRSTRD